jgi:hypothetical protein
MLFARLTPAIFISLGNAVARSCDVCGRFGFRSLGVRGTGNERESRSYNTPEQCSHHHPSCYW